MELFLLAASDSLNMSQCNVLSQALRSLSSAEFVTSTVQFHVVFSWGYRFETIGLGSFSHGC